MIDPLPPEDGSCIQCGQPRTYGKLTALYRVHADRDPFCSAKCCRVYYGCPLPIISGHGQKVEEVIAA